MSQTSLLKSRRFLPFFLTQFLGAFNDNIFKNVLMLLMTFGAAEKLGLDISLVLNLAALLFILPFFIFSAIAGQVTDKYDKSLLMQWVKFAEIVIMGLAALSFYFEFYGLLLLLLFLMGTQSTFFGPAKYAILPQHLHPDELVGGNALVEMGTFIAILLGTIGAGLIMEFSRPELVTAVMVVVLACLGYWVSRQIPAAAAEVPGLKLDFNIFKTTWEQIKFTQGDRPIYLAIMAISWFWFIGAAYLTQFPNYSKVVLNGDSSVVTLLLALFTIGIGLGSMVCERLSDGKVELGIVPIGALGLTVSGIALYLSSPNHVAGVQNWTDFLQQGRSYSLLLSLAGIGFFGGIFIVPLYAYVQKRAPAAHRARVIAVINIMNALYMVVSALAGILFLGILGLDIPTFFLVLAIMNLVVCFYIFHQVDEFAIRFFIWVLSHTIYRVSHEGLDRIPEEGPAVLVCNHVSFVDALLLAGACRRPIRFVMDDQIFKNPVLGWFFRLSKAIPIAPKHKNEKVYEEAFEKIAEELDDGQIVGIFPEGKLTNSGELNEFKSGIETIIENNPVPVIPMALVGLWGSFFSNKDGAAFNRMPKRFWSKVKILTGEAIPPEQVSARHLQDKVLDLRGPEPV